MRSLSLSLIFVRTIRKIRLIAHIDFARRCYNAEAHIYVKILRVTTADERYSKNFLCASVFSVCICAH